MKDSPTLPSNSQIMQAQRGSLTPLHRSDEVVDAASNEGYLNGLLTLIPSAGAMYVALKTNPSFAKRTNMQSRTAMVIMPALFVFALTSEKKLEHSMKQMAQDNKHAQATVHWAEEQVAHHSNPHARELHLMELYNESVNNSHNIVPELQFYHKAANYVHDNPIKVLASLAIPSVALIFWGHSGKEHLEFSHKLLHTRVTGQFATLGLVLSVFGFKDYMDRQGKFVSQADADARVAEIQQVRLDLVERLREEKQHAEDIKREIAKAHEEDLQDKKMKH